MPLDPQESCAFSARLWHRSVFILDPRLLVMELEQLRFSKRAALYFGPKLS